MNFFLFNQLPKIKINPIFLIFIKVNLFLPFFYSNITQFKFTEDMPFLIISLTRFN